MWLCVDENGQELIFDNKPVRQKDNLEKGCWSRQRGSTVNLPEGTIYRLTGKTLTWESEPIEIKEKLEKKEKLKKINWNVLVVSFIWATLVVILGGSAFKTSIWSTIVIIILVGMVFYFGYKDINTNE